MGYLGIMLIMRYHDDGGALVVQLGKQMHYLGSILGIEVTRRLIGKDELGTKDHGTGDGYSLLLTTRKLVREVLGTMADGHSLHNRLHLCLALRLRNIKIGKRKLDVLLYIQFIYQVETLEHKTDFSLSHIRALLFLQVCHLVITQEIFSRSWVVEQTEDVEQGGFATT